MTDKPKRKNGEPIPRRYWWIFGTLALVLLIGLRFPVRILYWWELNPILYGLLTLACLLAMVGFIRHYHWKRRIVLLMLACTLLAGWHFSPLSLGVFGVLPKEMCSAERYEFITTHHCVWEVCMNGGFMGPSLVTASYVTVRDLPIAMRTSYEAQLGCLF